MINKAFLSVSVLSAILLAGCDNKAKVPEAKESSTAATSSNSKPIIIGYSDWPVGWLGKLPSKKVG
jgi:NitT/TauT family transport system substrate-binding protein